MTEPHNFIEAAEDTVLVLARVAGIGRGSGVKVEVDVAHVWVLREGKIAGMTIYLDTAEGFHAARLE